MQTAEREAKLGHVCNRISHQKLSVLAECETGPASSARPLRCTEKIET